MTFRDEQVALLIPVTHLSSPALPAIRHRDTNDHLYQSPSTATALHTTYLRMNETKGPLIAVDMDDVLAMTNENLVECKYALLGATRPRAATPLTVRFPGRGRF